MKYYNNKYAVLCREWIDAKTQRYIVQIKDMLNPSEELTLGAVPFNGMSSELSDFDALL